MSSGLLVLFVTWQSPESRRIFPIARVMRRPSGEYEWAYVRAVSEAEAQGFSGLPGYTDLDHVTVSPDPPALFAHRVPARSRRRPASGASGAANDSFDPTPITLLVPVGPGRNERLEVFAPPLPGLRGSFWGVFVARGVGRIPGSEPALESLAPHEPLRVVPEPENPYNPRAQLLVRADGAPIGYLPDYLANELGDALGSSTSEGQGLPGSSGGLSSGPSSGLSVEVQSAERVTHPPAEPLYNVLCQYSCSAELGARLFRSERYRPRARGAASDL